MEERVTLPDLPIHRELSAPVTVGTQFSVRATPIDRESRPIVFALYTRKDECALEVSLHPPASQGRRARLRLASRNAAAETTPISKKVSTLAAGKELVLGVVVKEHTFEISLDATFTQSFVHRIRPSSISSLLFDGSAVCSEVVVMRAHHSDMPSPPSYAEIVLRPQTQAIRPPEAAPSARDDGPKQSSEDLFRSLYYLRHSRYSRMLKRRPHFLD